MSKSTVSLKCRNDRPLLGFVDCGLDMQSTYRNWFYLRETVKIQLTVYNGATVMDLTGLTNASLVAKPYDDYAGDVLVSSTNLTSTAAQLLLGVLEFTDVSFNTVELIAELGTDQSKPIALSVIETSGGVEERIIVQGNVNVVADVIRGDEGDPVYAYSLLHNTTATAAPTINDDTADGYAPGSIWVWPAATSNAGNARIWWCLDATEGAAVWEELTIIEIPFSLESPGNDTIPLIPYAHSAMIIVGVALGTESGTITGNLRIDGTSITGLGAVAIDSTMTVTTATALNLVAIGEKIDLVTTSNSSAVWLQGSILARRGS